MISIDVMTNIINEAVEVLDGAPEDSRQSILGLLLGWQEGIRIIKCKGDKK